MGNWPNGVWQWNFWWKRHLFAQEKTLLNEMIQLINQYNFVEGLDDNLLWKFDSTGCYNVKSFSMQVAKLVSSFSGDGVASCKV